MHFSSFRTVLLTLSGVSVNPRTWPHTQRLCYLTSSSAWGTSKWINASGFSPTRSPRWPARSGNTELYSAARANLKRVITKAKQDYKTKTEDQLSNHNPWQMWRGIQEITNFRGQNNTAVDSSDQLAEELNTFACFEIPTHTSAASLSPSWAPPSLLTCPGLLTSNNINQKPCC